MSSEGGHKPTLTVLGATGGCGLAFLVRALQAGHNCSACESYCFLKKRKKLNILLRAFVVIAVICLIFFLFLS